MYSSRLIEKISLYVIYPYTVYSYSNNNESSVLSIQGGGGKIDTHALKIEHNVLSCFFFVAFHSIWFTLFPWSIQFHLFKSAKPIGIIGPEGEKKVHGIFRSSYSVLCTDDTTSSYFLFLTVNNIYCDWSRNRK